jgi:hypothetical protein
VQHIAIEIQTTKKEHFMKWVTVLKVGGEGGDITLLGQDNGDDVWKYKLTTDETTLMDILSEEDAEGMDFTSTSPIIEDWDSIIQLFGKKYPYWMNMYPLECHPLFRERVWKLLNDGGGISETRSSTRWMKILKMKSDIEKARQLFQKAGFDLPAIPEKLAKQIKQREEEMLFSTRAIPMSPNFSRFYVDEVSNNKVGDYALISYSRNGASWMAIHYYLVFGPLRMFLELGRGGMYTDDEGDAIQVAKIRECFLLADKIVPATMAMCKANDRLTIFCSDFHGSYWVAPGQDAQETERRCHCPKDVLGEALQWLKNKRKFEEMI